MVAVRDKETRDLLSKINAEIMDVEMDPFYGAPCVIVVLADPDMPTWIDDGSLVLGHLMNAAHALALGSSVSGCVLSCGAGGIRGGLARERDKWEDSTAALRPGEAGRANRTDPGRGSRLITGRRCRFGVTVFHDTLLSEKGDLSDPLSHDFEDSYDDVCGY